MKNFKITILIFLILIVTLLSFYPCLKNNFTNWDDNFYVTENKAIRHVSLANLKNIFTSFFITHYQPATIFSYLLEYHFFKLNPFYYHLTNLILHFLNCLLVFWVIYMVSGRISVSCLTAIFFGLHPLQVESVAWISERKNVLYAFFFLGAMISYLYYLRKDRALKYYSLCLFLFTLSLLSKSMALTLPLVLLVLDDYSSRKINRALFIEKIPFLFLSLLFGLVAIFGVYTSTASYDKSSYDLLTRLMGASYDIIFHLSKLFLPIKLSALYPYAETKNNLLFLFSFITVIILLAGVIVSRRYSKKIIFGGGIFLLTIFPALRFLPLDVILPSDRFVYLPAVGIFYLLAEGYSWLYKRKIKHYRFTRLLLVAVLVLIVIFLSIFTWKRNQVWKDSLSLWNNVLKNYPELATAYNNRGEFFLGKGEYNKALSDFELAIKIRTKYPDNYMHRYYYLNLGNSLRALGRTQEASAVFEQLIKEEEGHFIPANFKELAGNRNKVKVSNMRALEAKAYVNLASIKDSLGDKNQAIALYVRAIEIDPRQLSAHDFLGVLYAGLNRKEEAKAEFIQAIEIDPTYKPAYVELAGIYKTLKQEGELELLYKKAIAKNLDFFDAYYYIGNLFADAQKDKDAIPLYRMAIEINPASKEACLGLGSSYLTIGRNKEAITWLRKALKLDPRLAVAHNNLAAAYYYAQEYDLAIKSCDQAIKLGYKTTPELLELLKPHRE